MRIYDQENWELRTDSAEWSGGTEVLMGPEGERGLASVTGPNHEEYARLIEHLPSLLAYVAGCAEGMAPAMGGDEARKLLEKAFDVSGMPAIQEALEL